MEYGQAIKDGWLNNKQKPHKTIILLYLRDCLKGDEMSTLLCLLGIHKWEYYYTDLFMPTDKYCVRCLKTQHIRDSTNLERQICKDRIS